MEEEIKNALEKPRKTDEEKYIDATEKLLRSIEMTRENRINASSRLLMREQFVQSINIYYSCILAVVTVLGLLYPQYSFSICSAVTSIILAMSIVYLNAQKYGSRAQQLQMNYLALDQLRYEVQNEIRVPNDKLAELQKRYVDLLVTSENHLKQDHWQTIWKRDKLDEYHGKEKKIKRLRGGEWIGYCKNIVLRALIQFFLWTLPGLYALYVIFVELK